MARELLDLGANLDVKDANGHSPLNTASAFGSIKVVKFLADQYEMHRKEMKKAVFSEALIVSAEFGKLEVAKE